MTKLILMFALTSAAFADLVGDVRASIAAGDFARGERQIAEYRQAKGATPEMILALSWLGRGAQAARNWSAAERYAAETRELALAALNTRALDAEKQLPLALGASIEVHAHALAAGGARTEAVAFLQEELKRWHTTSIRTRIQKNINLLSLEGKRAPALEMKEYLGQKPVPVAALKGKPVLLFFWAHWCGDCKYEGPILARLATEFGPKGLTIIGPTQRYGYVAAGAEASPGDELKYIEGVREKFYGSVPMTAPVSEENFKAWGASTTPTLVVIDRQGIVQLYHPGRMTYEQLQPVVARVTGAGS